MAVHPTALVHPSASLPPDAQVGPYALVDEDVEVGAGVSIGPFCHLLPGTRLEDGVSLADGVVVGGRPQDLKYRGEKTATRIGKGSQLREYVTVNRGTSASGLTSVGADCLLMAYTHVGHDSEVGDRVILANAVHLGGHVTVGEGAIVSGITGVNQFVSIGAGAFIGGGLRAIKDVLPFTKGLGDPMRYGGINPKGLQRQGYPTSSEGWLKSAYRVLAGDGKAGCLAWLSEEAGKARGSGDAATERLAALVGAYLARQTRSLLIRDRRDGRDGLEGRNPGADAPES